MKKESQPRIDFSRDKKSAIRNQQSEILLGAHMSIAGGAHLAIERACSINCTAMQIFVKNNMQWFARPLSTGEIRAFLDHQQRGQLASVFAHANYLINLGAGEEAGLDKIGASIDAIWRVVPKLKTKIALETTAGQGSCLGHRFEQIAQILNKVREPERLCVCLDTAHIFAAGYDLGSDIAVKKTFREFDRVIGRDRLAAIHLNDSKAARGSHVDRHAHIGKG